MDGRGGARAHAGDRAIVTSRVGVFPKQLPSGELVAGHAFNLAVLLLGDGAISSGDEAAPRRADGDAPNNLHAFRDVVGQVRGGQASVSRWPEELREGGTRGLCAHRPARIE